MAVLAEKGSGRQKRQLARRLGILTDAQAAMGWFVIVALAALVGAIYLNQASNIAARGRLVQDLQGQLGDLRRENAALERTIAEAQSLDRLQQEAARLGFVRGTPEDTEYLVVSQYPAVPTGYSEAQVLSQTTSVAPSPAPAESFSEALILVFQSAIADMVWGHATQ